jgi:hypothetical protein
VIPRTWYNSGRRRGNVGSDIYAVIPKKYVHIFSADMIADINNNQDATM